MSFKNLPSSTIAECSSLFCSRSPRSIDRPRDYTPGGERLSGERESGSGDVVVGERVSGEGH